MNISSWIRGSATAIVILAASGLASATAPSLAEGKCKCTNKDIHESHVSIVALVRVRPNGQTQSAEELAGSVTHLCKHNGTQSPDGIVWHNESKKDAKTVLYVVFEAGKWPFDPPQRRIRVGIPGESSDVYYARSDTTGWFDYQTVPPLRNSKWAVKKAGKMFGVNMPQPGPAVIVDE